MDYLPGPAGFKSYNQNLKAMNCRGKLIKAAIELNRTLGLDPPIKLGLPIDQLKAKVIEAGKIVWPEDDLTDETLDTLRKLGVQPPEPPEHYVFEPN